VTPKAFTAATPALALGLLLVTQALARPQFHTTDRVQPKVHDAPGVHAATNGNTGSSGSVSTNVNIVNRIFQNERLALGRNYRLLGQQMQIDQRLMQLFATTPTTAAIQAQITNQTTLFNQLSRLFSLNQIHIGNSLPGYDAQVASSLAALEAAAPNNAAVAAFIVQAMRNQMSYSAQLLRIQTLPPATPFMPST
jgi:hypothetical protein